MYFKKSFLLLVLFAVSSLSLLMAQPRGGGGGFNPEEMIAREKEYLFKNITDLTDDQKMIIEGIYEEFGVSLKEVREEARKNQDFQSARPKMQALRTEKDELMKDVLNVEQFKLYEKMQANQRERRQQSRNN
jgi:Spy/CpxP family protein refolding chaperone